ncbi:MAG: hypothetical protein ACREJ2_04845 [Planctomycetota bacterium]
MDEISRVQPSPELKLPETSTTLGGILLPETKTKSLADLISRCAREKRIVSLVVRSGERFHLQLTDFEGHLITGRCRVLEWSPEMTRKLLAPYLKSNSLSTGMENEIKPFFFADAIAKYGKQAHVYSVSIDLDNVMAVAIDETTETNELPFTRIP